MVNKNFCLSSYFAFRYVWKEDVNFFKGMKHEIFKAVPKEKRIKVSSAKEIDENIKKQFEELYNKYDSIGILLSGGMDSAILASYLKPGSNAYTFTADGTSIFNADVERARKYTSKFQLNHQFINISFEDYQNYTPIVMHYKGAPVHSIEPQLYKAAVKAKEDGVELLIVGESADLIFGGMDGLLSKDWTYEEFKERYTFLNPSMVLNETVDMDGLFAPYKQGNNIDFQGFVEQVYSEESSGSYLNAFKAAGIPYCDPYAILEMKESLDLRRVRSGEPKYLIRDLFAIKYPEIPVPDKIPMPRPVDKIFENWNGPKRVEFKKDIPMNSLTGNQKWQLWCAEKFLNMYSL